MNIQNKQYVVSSKPLAFDGMTEYSLSGAYLYVAGDLPYHKTLSTDGIDVYLLGNAICMDAKGKTSVEDIRQSSFNELEYISRNWTGRWIMIGNGQLITDACGLMSAFYYQGNDEWIVSSSLALISQILHKPITGEVRSMGLTWQLLPNTLIDGVKALFGNQILSWDAFGLSIEYHNRFEDKTSLSTEEKASHISAMLQNALWNIQHYSGKNIILALTAGKDSRLTLAAALSSGIDFKTYTALHSNISNSDKKLPGEISKRFGFSHRIIKPQKRDNNRIKEYLYFSGHNSKGADLDFYANGQFDDFTCKDIIIRSGIFEAAQHYGRSIISEGTFESFGNAFCKYYAMDMTSKQEAAMSEWIEYAKANPIPNVDIRDRFYVEQRVNGWVAAIEQAMDINDFTSIQIANCAELISILLSATDEERSRLALSFEPIRIMLPELLEYPVNKRMLTDTIRIYYRGLMKRLKRIARCRQ